MRGRAVASRARSEATSSAIRAALSAHEPALVDFVSHGVGELLDGIGAADRVAVQVEVGVQLCEGQLAVAPEEGEANRPEAAAAEDLGVVAEGRKRTLVGAGRAAAVVAGHDRPHQVAQLLGLLDEGAALRGALDRLGVEDGELSEDRVELSHVLLVDGTTKPGVEAKEEEVARVAAASVHGGRSRRERT